MTKSAHLWAIGYDDMERAEQVREEFIRLGWHTHYLDLLDIAVVVRHPDGSFTYNREPFPAVANILDVHVINSLPVMPGTAYTAWVDSKPVQMVWGVDYTMLFPDAAGGGSD